MKRIFTLALLGLSAGLQAQITLTQSSFAGWTPKDDTISTLTGTISAPMGTNVTYDITGATYGTPFQRTMAAGTNPAYPAATYYNTLRDLIPSATNPGIAWTSKQHRANTSAGMMMYGESLDRAAAKIIVTTNPADSVVFPAQDVPYSTPRTLLPFPATVSTSWTNNYKYTVNFNVTVMSYGFVAVPCARVTYATEQYSIPGWGRMRVKKADGSVSGFMDVLGVKGKVQYLDSLMFNGGPAPMPVLSGFGFEQAAVLSGFTMSYYREGEVTPLLKVVYNDSAHTSIKSAEVNMNRLASASTGISGVSSAPVFNLYPNPAVNGNNLNIQLTEAQNGAWSVELIDAAGRVVLSAPVQFSNNTAQLPLNNAAAGTHYLRLYKNGQPEATKPVIIK